MRAITVILILCSVLAGCKKNGLPANTGTATIENTLLGTGPYYAYGFSFSTGSKVTTISDPGPDITLVISRSGGVVSFETSSFINSFSLVGEFSDENAASEAFKSYRTVENPLWIANTGELKTNQIWLFRSGSGNYSKIRIISLTKDTSLNNPYASCTFEWVYQPDGTATFPL